MAFFGLPERDLDPDEDVAVYTWGEESYDGLGDALQEGGDDLNDETFGTAGPIGKDFDFSNPVLPDDLYPVKPQQQQQPQPQRKEPEVVREVLPQRRLGEDRYEYVQSQQLPPPSRSAQSPTARQVPQTSLESIWHDQSAFSALPRTNGTSRIASADQQRVSPVSNIGQTSTRFSPFGNASSPVISHGAAIGSHSRARTLQEIEAEMLANAQKERERQREREQQREQQEYLLQQQERLLHQQQQQQQQQQQLLQQQLLQQRLREEEARQQRLLYQQEQLAAQQQQQSQVQRLLLQQRDQLQQQHTPPPRMISSQSPRFHEHQRQLLILQQQKEQQQRLQDLQDQARFEELERRMAAVNMERTRGSDPVFNDRHTPNFSVAELQEAQRLQLLQQAAQERQFLLQQQQQQQQQQQYRRQGSRSPAVPNKAQYAAALREAMPQFQNQNVQLQQRLLADLAHGDFPRDIGGSHAEQEALRLEAMRKILEAEKMEEKRRRKAAKIAHMARYNDLMTQSDKDFITRIQVSQLVTQDPYADDFYAQVYGAIMRSRMGLQSQDERVLKFGSGGGIGLGLASKGGSRRPSAMQRMEQQVERIVSNARKREEEKGLHAIHSLQGALGKTSGRSYKAAPRQLLQVDSGAGASPTLSHATANLHIGKSSSHHHEGAAKEAAKLGREALGIAGDTDNLVKKEPLSHRKALVILEELYDVVLRVEQLRRDQPAPEDIEASQEWKKEYDSLVDGMWDELRVMVPLETSDPHPFISLLTPTKGKKILPRLTRHLNSQRMLTLLTLLVACFGQLDVVKNAPVLDSIQDTQARADVERQTQAFLGSVMQSILPVVSVANLRLVTGLLGLLLDRSNIVAVAQTRPGLALLTLFLSRVEVIKQTIAASDLSEAPTIEESQQWRLMFDHLFQLLAPHLLRLFPSSRIINPDPTRHPIPTDIVDQPVWQFFAALALHGVIEQHHILVGSLREKILDNVLSVNKGWVHDEDERQTKLANVNLFLHAVNLDSSQIAM